MDDQNLNQPAPDQPAPDQPPSNNTQTPTIMPKSKSKKKIGIVPGIFIIIIIALTIYLIPPKTEQETINKPVEDSYKPTIAFPPEFATYKEVAVNINPKVPAYSVNQDLSNVTNAVDFTFSD